MIYVTIAAYFLLFFFRRRQDRENLYFALFLLSFILYSFFRTQFKYEFGWPLFITKRIQFLTLFASVPLFFLFITSYFPLPEKPWATWFNRIAWLVMLIPAGAAVMVLASPSGIVWQATLDYVQPTWIFFILGILFVVLRETFIHKDKDAMIMIGAILILVAALVVDTLAGRGRINLPTLLTHAFTLFVIAIALVLANRFVRLHDETEELNANLASLNRAAQRFVPFEFLNILEKRSLLEVNLGDQVQREMTVVFSDIRGFTTLSEKMTPKENFDFIN
jgi:adenylate cyclase